jgi:hypothetical protein
MYIGLHVQFPLFFLALMKLEFSRQIFEKTVISNFMNIYRVGAELFREDGQTDGQRDRQSWSIRERRSNMTKLIVLFAILLTLLKLVKLY